MTKEPCFDDTEPCRANQLLRMFITHKKRIEVESFVFGGRRALDNVALACNLAVRWGGQVDIHAEGKQ